MSAQSLPAATPPTQKPPRIIRPRPPSRSRAAQSPGPPHNGSSPQELPRNSNDAPTPMCTPIFWEPPAASLKPPALLPPSASRASLDSQTSPDSPSSTPTPSPVSRRSASPEPAPRSPVPPPKPSGSPCTPLLPMVGVLAQNGSASAPGTVRRLAGRFEGGAEGRAQDADAPEPGLQARADVNGEREAPLTGSGSQENGAPEPLYQTYRAAVLSEELWGVGEDGSPSPANAGDAPTFPRPPGPRNTLWQELPAVQASGLLDTLSPQERRMQESLFEVVTSEASYLRSLRLLTDTFVLSQALRDTLTPRDHHTLFSNVQRVQGVSERFLATLLSRVRSSPHISDLCDVVHAHAVGPFSVYVDYVRNQQYQEETYSRLMDTNVRFSAELRRLQSLPKCERLPLPSFLLLPFQRITRLRMLLQNILRQTEEGSSRQENAQKALGAVSKIIERCSAEVGRMKQTEELIRLTQRLRFHKVKALPLVSWSRRLEFQGELTELGCRRGGMLFASRPRFTPLCLLLFSDLLLITQPKSGQRLQVLDYAHRSLVQAQQVPDPSGPPTFRLSLLSNHQGRPTHRLLQASSLSDMQRWLGAFPTPGPLPCSPDTIYEDCDCSQELCSESSAPAKTEGRSLESRAAPKHLHKTPEGWLKGLPGAFPAQLVCEVTGEHERRRHLRQNQRLLEAVGPSSGTPNAPPP
ncbi:rho guanine nucleotide exchange factor 15 isoform X3 [Pan troglodytes]|uniref:rho guanine nucleotide exchange factor 15 isoform X3 n=1 Tax=Pan troglodytes TaxID=9598 RepID=UPI000D09C422|nr:rho guanine nucleotide exchange factor 15 isoform X3 [Pan troglodytes]